MTSEDTPAPNRLRTIYLNAYGDPAEELYQLAVSPAREWGGKGPHLSFSLYRPDGRYPDQFAAVRRADVEALYEAIGSWLADTEELSELPGDAVPLVPAPELDRLRARIAELETAGDQLAATARRLAYTWETDSTDTRMWDAWKKVGPARHAWLDARRGEDTPDADTR